MEIKLDIDELKIKKGKDGSYRVVTKTKMRQKTGNKMKNVGVGEISFGIVKQDIKLQLEKGNESVTVSLY